MEADRGRAGGGTAAVAAARRQSVDVLKLVLTRCFHYHMPAVARCLADCLLSPRDAAAAGRGGGAGSSASASSFAAAAAKQAPRSSTALGIRVEAVGSGNVLIQRLEVEPTDSVRALKQELRRRLGLMAGCRLFLNHGGPELQLERLVPAPEAVPDDADEAGELCNVPMHPEDETLSGAGCVEGAVVVVLNSRALTLDPHWAARLRSEKRKGGVALPSEHVESPAIITGDGSRVVVAARPHELQVYSLQNGRELPPLRGLVCDPRGAFLAAVPGDGDRVAVLDAAAGHVWVMSLAEGSGSARVALRIPRLGRDSQQGAPYDVCLTTTAANGKPAGVAFITANKRRLQFWAATAAAAATGGPKGPGGEDDGGGGAGKAGKAAVAACDLVELEPVKQAFGLAVTPDGQVLVAGGPDGRLRLWRARTRVLLRKVPMFNCAVQRVAVAADNQTIAALLDHNSVGIVRIPALATAGSGGGGGRRAGNGEGEGEGEGEDGGGDATADDDAIATGPLASQRLRARQVNERDYSVVDPSVRLSLSADGRSVALSYSTNQCIVWSTETQAQQLSIMASYNRKRTPGHILGFVCGGDDYIVGNDTPRALRVRAARARPWLGYRKFDSGATIFGASLGKQHQTQEQKSAP